METDRVVDETLFGEIIKEEPPEKESISKLNVSYVSYLGSEEDSEESKHSLICADEQEDVIADEDGICGAVDTKTEYEIDIIYEDVKSKIDEKAINSEEHILIERRENVPEIISSSFTKDSGMQPNCIKKRPTINKKDIYSQNKEHQCKFCLRTFFQKYYLKIHERLHTGERPYQCKLCAKSFKSNSVLSDHQICHIGEKIYNCKLCSKSYLRKKHLVRHQITHTGEKPFHFVWIPITAF